MLNKNKDASNHLMEKNSELVKINHELDRFVYSASHDLRAPLTTLLGLIQIARFPKHENELQDIFEMMTNRIHSMDRLLNNISEYSQNARLEVSNERVKVAELIKSICAENQFLADQENIHFEMEVPEDLYLWLDQVRVKVILNNLVANAIKYHDHLAEKFKYIKIAAAMNEKVWTIYVKDNGEGIHEKYKPKIFDLFFRASEKSKGSGLGLYIAKETVNKLNGTISCYSTLGVGSEFVITLPLLSR
jgi:signal transduction histidine kinase